MDHVNDHPDQEVFMERLYIAFSHSIPEAALVRSNAKVRVYELAIGGLVGQLSAWLLDGHKRDVRIEYREMEFPSTPWQFWKQKYAPKWFVNRFPVQRETTRYEIAHHHHFVCPHVSVEDSADHYRWIGYQSGQIKDPS